MLAPSEGPHRGLVYVAEDLGEVRSAAQRVARQFEAATPGAFSLGGTRRGVPSLRFDNPPGRNFTKFDGKRLVGEITELIDAKTRLLVIPKSRGPFVPQGIIDGLRNKSRALTQNRGFRGVLEFPTAEEAEKARRILRDLGISNLRVRVR